MFSFLKRRKKSFSEIQGELLEKYRGQVAKVQQPQPLGLMFHIERMSTTYEYINSNRDK